MDSGVPPAPAEVTGTGGISPNRTWHDLDRAVQVIEDPEAGEVSSRAVIVMDRVAAGQRLRARWGGDEWGASIQALVHRAPRPPMIGE